MAINLPHAFLPGQKPCPSLFGCLHGSCRFVFDTLQVRVDGTLNDMSVAIMQMDVFHCVGGVLSQSIGRMRCSRGCMYEHQLSVLLIVHAVSCSIRCRFGSTVHWITCM